MSNDFLVVIRSGGEIASAVAWRLHRAGYPTVVLELPAPLVVRRRVAFAAAVFSGECEVEGVPGKLVASVREAREYIARRGGVPVLIDPDARSVRELSPTVLIDGRMAKRALDTRIGQAPIVIGLGPGFTAGVHADAVIETNSGPSLGRVIYEGSALPNTGIPCRIGGFQAERVLRAPRAGVFHTGRDIGDAVEQGEIVGYVDEAPVRAGVSGVLWGLLHPGIRVDEGTKLGDIDPRGDPAVVECIAAKGRAVAAGTLAAIRELASRKHITLPNGASS